LNALPFGALPADTAEFMLGTVAVTLVLMESNGQVDPSTEDWTPALIQQVKQKVQEGLNWWKETLSRLNTVHGLEFVYDFTYADNPVPTRYEPISRISDQYTLWVNEFLDFVGFNSAKPIDDDIRQFNHAQRLRHNTNWAFTIFVVNSTNDPDGQFAPGGSFNQAFAFAGGRFIVAPSTRPASTFAHETGHMFWARDEYLGGGSWSDRRGYYDTQNWNAADNPTPGFVQQDSIMAAGTKLLNAYQNFTSAASTLAHVGWQDSDGDGVFDVLDVPHELTGVGYRDPVSGRYRFLGSAKVGTLPNRNSSGLQNDITINTITRAEYRIDGGTWTAAANYGTATASLNLSIPVPAGDHLVEIRTVTIDPLTQRMVTSSPVFMGSTTAPSQIGPLGISGFVWNDVDGDGQWDSKEIGLPGRTVRLLDNLGNPIALQQTVEPDRFDDATRLNNAVSGVRLSAVGWAVLDDRVLSRTSPLTSTGNRVFAFATSPTAFALDWRRDAQELHIQFDSPQSFVALDAIGFSAESYARMEAYDASGTLLARYNTGRLDNGQVETMVLVRNSPDIALVKAFGRAGTSVALDNLRIGPLAVASSGIYGGYSFTALPPGTYLVEIVSPAGSQVTAPTNGFFTVNFPSGGNVTGRNFGLQPARPWQNPIRTVDVTGDGVLTTLDVLTLVREISLNGARMLPPPNDAVGPAPFFDVNGDNVISTIDVFPVINALRGGGAGEPPGIPPSGLALRPRQDVHRSTLPRGTTQPEGEPLDAGLGSIWSDIAQGNSANLAQLTEHGVGRVGARSVPAASSHLKTLDAFFAAMAEQGRDELLMGLPLDAVARQAAMNTSFQRQSGKVMPVATSSMSIFFPRDLNTKKASTTAVSKTTVSLRPNSEVKVWNAPGDGDAREHDAASAAVPSLDAGTASESLGRDTSHVDNNTQERSG
jgi:hypothetical protein